MLGCTPSQSNTSANENATPAYDYTADVLIIGGGGAGQMAAVSAHEAGRSSIILEKASLTGGDSITSHNDLLAYWPDSHAGENGDDFDSYLDDWKATHWVSYMGQLGRDFPNNEFPFARRFMELWAPVGQWLEDNAGVKWTGVSLGRALATEYTPTYRTWHAENEPIMTSLYRVISGWDDCETLLDTEAFELIQNENGVVTGVRAYQYTTGKTITLHANRGVVLATGTFCASRDMVSQFYGRDVAQLSTTGFMNLTGDGHRMARNIGAGFTGMDLGMNWQPCGAGSRNWDTIEGRLYLFGYYDGALAPSDPAIAVNLEGKRFMNEDQVNYGIGRETGVQTGQTAFYVFDSRFDCHVIYEDREVMLKDNTIYYQADTLEELAIRMNCDARGFLDEIDRYNGFVDSGVDEDWGRDVTAVSKIEQGPFYAFPIVPQYYVTFGGVKTSVESEVLTEDGRVIPGLYAAGVVCGSYAEQEGLVYYGGFNQALSWGSQAGANAANFDPTNAAIEPAPEGSDTQTPPTTASVSDAVYADGTYEAAYDGKEGPVPVTVSVTGGKITAVEIGANSETEGIGTLAIDALPGQIVYANSADVDAISGATLTSNAILSGVADCLRQAS
jgi:fumarate reductase flavoprotein subunit